MQLDWDEEKNEINKLKHRIPFEEAQDAFFDPRRLIFQDTKHSTKDETRYYCLGMVGTRVYTVRYTIRGHTIRIFGAGFWRKEQKIYEKINKTH